MRKGYRKRDGVGKASQRERRARRAGQGRAIQLRLDPGELVATLQESVVEFATEIGLKVASLLLEDEVAQQCGPRYERRPDRAVTRYGHQRGVAVMAGQKLPIERSRMRYMPQLLNALDRLILGKGLDDNRNVA